MGEYGPGMTMGRAGELDKERVWHALAGELMCGEDENGFVYEPAPRDECERCILSVVDNWVYQAKQMADSGLEELHEQADAALREGEGR